MSSFFILMTVAVLVAYEIKRGIAILGINHLVRRKEAAGPFWGVIAVQIFCAVVLAVAVTALQSEIAR